MADTLYNSSYPLQSPGSQCILNYAGLVGMAGAVNKIYLFCPFCFLAHNNNYLVSVGTIAIDGIIAANITSTKAFTKTLNGVDIEITTNSASSVTYRTVWSINISLVITFA